MAREIVMGIDVGTSAVKTIILEKDRNDVLPVVLGTGFCLTNGMRRGYITEPNEVAKSIIKSVNQARENANLKTKEAFVSIGGAGLSSVRSKGSVMVGRADNEITEGDIKRAISQSETQLNRSSSSYLLNREILHTFPLSFKVDGNPVMAASPVDMKGEKLEVETLFITCLNHHLTSLIKSMENAGIQIADVVAMPYAMSNTLLGPKEKEIGSLLINIGGDTSSVIVFEENSPISSEIFSIGSNHITYDIARGFQIPVDNAEELKISFGEDASIKKRLQSIIEPRLKDIFELVENHLNKINKSGLLPAGAIITGGGANIQNIDEIARKSLTLPVQLTQPKFLEGCRHPVSNPIWSVALGLCLNNLNGPKISPKNFGKGAKNVLGKWFRLLLP